MSVTELSMREQEERYNDQLMTSVALGEEARLFLQSRLADYVRNAAEIKLMEARRQLDEVDPTDTKKIVKLQKIIGQFNHYEQCLESLVTAGDSAYQLYLQSLEQD